MTEAKYRIKAIPADNKSWKECDNIEVVLVLDVENEEKSFKGIIPLFGIIKKPEE